jgi:hypothetical protein
MNSKAQAQATPMVRLLKFLTRGEAREVGCEGAISSLRRADGSTCAVPAAVIGQAMAAGLIERHAGTITLCPQARSYLRRATAERDEAFIEQHQTIEQCVRDVDGKPRRLRINRDESPLATLSRLKDRDGKAFMPEAAMAAGERLLADFTRGQLQPRVTASWEPRLASRANGARGGMADLTDSAMAARLTVNRALEALGPELSGVALDVCCFMKGLEAVERERQWPVRSAKLMLRTALLALSRHYNPPPSPRRPRMEHWGTRDYRPELYS